MNREIRPQRQQACGYLPITTPNIQNRRILRHHGSKMGNEHIDASLANVAFV